MIPLRDDNPTRHVPVITLLLIGLNFAAFLFWEPTFGTQAQQQTFFYCNAMIPWEVSRQTTLGDGGDPAQRALANGLNESRDAAVKDQAFLADRCSHKVWWESIFVAMFLHGGWLHILGNMLFLWIFGNNVEDKLGVIGYPIFYLASGLAATFAQLAIGSSSVVPNLGASGAIAGVLGAYLVMFPKRRVLTLVIFFFITWVYLPAYVVLGLWFVLQLFSGVGELGSRVNSGGGVAFWAHIGGFAFGAAMAILFFPKERFGAQPPPRRPDARGRSFGWGGRRRPPPDETGWRPF